MDQAKAKRYFQICMQILTQILLFNNLGWRTVGLIPILNASKATKDTTEFRDWKAFMYHECWRRLLQSIETAREAEGVYLDVCGQRRLFIPEIAFVAQDSQEVRSEIYVTC